MKNKPLLTSSQTAHFRARFGNKKQFSQALMPVRGPYGFRELDYDFPNKLDPQAIINKIKEHGFNSFGLVVKDTDGATLANTPHSWNPSGRDLVAEFAELCEQNDIIFMISVTNMNDAYRGYTNPETVSIHFKNPKIFAKDHSAGDAATHPEGEMRVTLPEGVTFEEMKKRIPFLTKKYDGEIGASRDARGQGYIPLTSFHCPRSKHAEYMIKLIKELTQKYSVDGVLADYIRFHHGYTDLCGCERCRKAFSEEYPGKEFGKGREWIQFKKNTIVEYGQRFNDAIKSVDEEIVTGWFSLPGPKIYTNRFIAQDYRKLTKSMDTALPMTYPYLTGTIDDGKRWGLLGNAAHWYFQRNMKRRFRDYAPKDSDKGVFCITNSVECNSEEMLKQCIAYDYGLGIALFKYFGTSDAQWYACKLYSEILNKQEVGDPAPTKKEIRAILRQVYKKYPPKVTPRWWKKEQRAEKMGENNRG
ncbi:MAG: hypothetical protein GF364_20855 [Candidatus Lokiarchaeota archaeon]|nr:hypothetical protein [Candidatus Lokiarchaeota archaeon]